MMIFGITGSIGTGKSTLSAMIHSFGIPVLDSDKQVHILMAENKDVKKEIQFLFPDVVKNGVIQRHLLGQKVFSNDFDREKLEGILYPYLSKERQKFLKKAQEKGIENVAFDIPLLYEKGLEKECDRVILVTAPYHIQKERVLQREGMTEEKFLRILSQQWSQSQKALKADVIIPNSLDKEYAYHLLKAYLRKEGLNI